MSGTSDTMSATHDKMSVVDNGIVCLYSPPDDSAVAVTIGDTYMIINLKIPAYIVDSIQSQTGGDKSVTKYIMDLLKENTRVPKEEQRNEDKEPIRANKAYCSCKLQSDNI